MSSTAHRLLTPTWGARFIASHTEPSAISPSPSSTYTRSPPPPWLIASAIPMAAASPWPNDPVATRTPGARPGIGCPSRRLSKLRSSCNSATGMVPASAQAAYSTGAACPLDSTNSSLASASGWRGS